MINNIIRGLVVAFVGVLLIVLNESALPFLVRLSGTLFFLPALVSLVNLYAARHGAPIFPMLMMSVINVGSCIIGLLLMLFPATFLELFVLLLALVLLCFSLLQLYGAVSVYRVQKRGSGLFVVPSLLVVVSVIVLFNPFSVIFTASIFIGICLVISGVSDVVIYLFGRKRVPAGLQKKQRGF